MGDFEKVLAECEEAHGTVTEINDATARVIASMYHTGQGGLSYPFASTGLIASPTGVYRECFSNYDTLTIEEKLVANMFGTYLLNREHRGTVAGWSDLWL